MFVYQSVHPSVRPPAYLPVGSFGHPFALSELTCPISARRSSCQSGCQPALTAIRAAVRPFAEPTNRPAAVLTVHLSSFALRPARLRKTARQSARPASKARTMTYLPQGRLRILHGSVSVRRILSGLIRFKFIQNDDGTSANSASVFFRRTI